MTCGHLIDFAWLSSPARLGSNIIATGTMSDVNRLDQDTTALGSTSRLLDCMPCLDGRPDVIGMM